MKPGKKPGSEKTGGRQKGTPNKKNIRMRDRFAEEGFDFAKEVIKALSKFRIKKHMDEKERFQVAKTKMDYLVSLTPFFMQKLREDSEVDPTPPLNPDSPAQEDLSDVPTDELLSALPGRPGAGH